MWTVDGSHDPVRGLQSPHRPRRSSSRKKPTSVDPGGRRSETPLPWGQLSVSEDRIPMKLAFEGKRNVREFSRDDTTPGSMIYGCPPAHGLSVHPALPSNAEHQTGPSPPKVRSDAFHSLNCGGLRFAAILPVRPPQKLPVALLAGMAHTSSMGGAWSIARASKTSWQDTARWSGFGKDRTWAGFTNPAGWPESLRTFTSRWFSMRTTSVAGCAAWRSLALRPAPGPCRRISPPLPPRIDGR